MDGWAWLWKHLPLLHVNTSRNPWERSAQTSILRKPSTEDIALQPEVSAGSAVYDALHTVELLEVILLALPMLDVIRLQAVSRHFK